MITKDEIINECEKLLKESQFIVDVKVKNTNNFSVFIDDFNGLSIDECKRINKHIRKALDQEDEDFSLEVSSPGLDKAFKVKQQYIKNLNKDIEILYKDGEKISCKLLEVNDNDIIVEVPSICGKKKENQTVEYKHIKSAKVLLTF